MNKTNETGQSLDPVRREQMLILLRARQQDCDDLRKQLGISLHDEVIAQYPGEDDRDLMVIADGFGHARVLEVEGNYPIDYLIIHSRTFTSEEEAGEFAEALDEGTAEWLEEKP